MRIPKSGSLVRVDWDDASSNDAWSDAMPSLTECVTVGFLIGATRRRVNLAATAARGTDRYGERVTIPRGAVRRIKRMKGRMPT